MDGLFFHLIDMFNEGKSNGTNNILDNIKELPEEVRPQENAIDDESKPSRKSIIKQQQQSSELIPQSKLDSIQQLQHQQVQQNLQPKVQENIVLRNQQIASNPQARQGCC